MASLATPKLQLGLRPARPSPARAVPCCAVHGMPHSQASSTLHRTPTTALTAMAAAVFLAFSPISASPANANTVIQGPARVVDGDTLVINQQRIRLYGIDAPEKAQSCRDVRGSEYSCGQRSKEALTAKVGSQSVTCQVRNQDQYGRNVSVCSLGGPLGGEELNAWLVKNGLAVAYRQYGADYVPLEEQAKAAHVGVWEGPFTPPNEWRKQQKAGGAATANQTVASLTSAIPTATNLVNASAPSCPGGAPPIKGNIGKSGDKIYHKPGGALYDRVKIDLQDGERYFCTDAEAQAAGWRAAKN